MTNTNAYLPLYALRKLDIQSMLSVAFPFMNDDQKRRRYDMHHSRRTMLYFLKSIFEAPDNEQIINTIKECAPRISLENINNNYNMLKAAIEPYQQQYRAEKYGNYWELKLLNRPGPKKAAEYISVYRANGFNENELKIYWNYDEIKDLNKDGRYNKKTDQNTHDALIESPVNTRRNSGRIEFIQSGIEDAVFQVPQGKQIIVLDFADERMPGGYFLENARTQEEVILYNSDGYRALLDLKYRMMDGGYMLPEYGVAYVKNVRFFQNELTKPCLADLIVAACYDLSGMGEGLYKPPSFEKVSQLRSHTYEKLQAVIASAVANTNGTGAETYLLLGPIGTGAFGNDMHMIAEIFSEILNGQLMDSEGPIRYAFDQIWFVSIDNLDVFKQYLNNDV